MGNLDNVQNVMNNWWTYSLVWVGIVVAVFFILVLVLVWAKLSSVARASKQSFKDLNNKIDSMARTNDAFSELNAKIDNLNKSTIEQKRSTTEYVATI
jgi:predicted PurR-regulated permease PerM